MVDVVNLLHIAATNAANAAHHHRQQANTCAAMAELLRAIAASPSEPMPVERLAEALLKLDLCIVHRSVVKAALDAVDGTGGSDFDPSEISTRLSLALTGRAA